MTTHSDASSAHDTRAGQLSLWLASLPAALAIQPDTLRPASGDASFRRYFRIDAHDGPRVVMDAPPPHENCAPFIDVTTRLQQADVRVPTIDAADAENGFLLLEDLGEHTYFDWLQQPRSEAAVQERWRAALAELVRLQQADASGLPAYDAARLQDELSVFVPWYAERHCGQPLSETEQQGLDAACALLVSAAHAQPRVLVHRDFHSPNLMLAADEHGRPGVIDYQDAVLGPITYDIASLAMDARHTWEEAEQIDWTVRYWEAARAAGLPVGEDFAAFHQAYEWMGLQRNLRIMGVFARLAHRDGKRHYLAHLPRVRGYVLQVAERYQPLRPIARLVERLASHEPAA